MTSKNERDANDVCGTAMNIFSLMSVRCECLPASEAFNTFTAGKKADDIIISTILYMHSAYIKFQIQIQGREIFVHEQCIHTHMSDQLAFLGSLKHLPHK